MAIDIICSILKFKYLKQPFWFAVFASLILSLFFSFSEEIDYFLSFMSDDDFQKYYPSRLNIFSLLIVLHKDELLDFSDVLNNSFSLAISFLFIFGFFYFHRKVKDIFSEEKPRHFYSSISQFMFKDFQHLPWLFLFILLLLTGLFIDSYRLAYQNKGNQIIFNKIEEILTSREFSYHYQD